MAVSYGFFSRGVCRDFADREIDVPAGGTVFVPAGVAHTYQATEARYLIILTPRLDALIGELQARPDPKKLPAIYRKYESTLLEEGAA